MYYIFEGFKRFSCHLWEFHIFFFSLRSFWSRDSQIWKPFVSKDKFFFRDSPIGATTDGFSFQTTLGELTFWPIFENITLFPYRLKRELPLAQGMITEVLKLIIVFFYYEIYLWITDTFHKSGLLPLGLHESCHPLRRIY